MVSLSNTVPGMCGTRSVSPNTQIQTLQAQTLTIMVSEEPHPTPSPSARILSLWGKKVCCVSHVVTAVHLASVALEKECLDM